MRESVASLSAFFCLGGVLEVGYAFTVIRDSHFNLAGTIMWCIGLALGACYIWLGANLPKLIVSAPRWILNVLIASCCFFVLQGFLGPKQVPGLVHPVVGLLVIGYLIHNVRRLTCENKAGTIVG
jgi:hypothetical protein